MIEALLEWPSPIKNYKVVFELTARNAYGYLRLDRRIVSHVWLFNVGESPSEPEWDDLSLAPFCNPKMYCCPEPFRGMTDPHNEITGQFVLDAGGGGLRYCIMSIKGRVHAVLIEGEKPGYCRLAAKTGPLAKPLEAFNESA